MAAGTEDTETRSCSTCRVKETVQQERTERTGVATAAGSTSCPAICFVFHRLARESEEDLRQKVEWLQLRRDHERQLQDARDELNDVISSEPALAIVEEDLFAYDASATSDAIAEAELGAGGDHGEAGSRLPTAGSTQHRNRRAGKQSGQPVCQVCTGAGGRSHPRKLPKSGSRCSLPTKLLIGCVSTLRNRTSHRLCQSRRSIWSS